VIFKKYVADVLCNTSYRSIGATNVSTRLARWGTSIYKVGLFWEEVIWYPALNLRKSHEGHSQSWSCGVQECWLRSCRLEGGLMAAGIWWGQESPADLGEGDVP